MLQGCSERALPRIPLSHDLVVGRYSLRACKSWNRAYPFVSRRHLQFRTNEAMDHWWVRILTSNPFVRIERADKTIESSYEGWISLDEGDILTFVFDENRNIHYLRYQLVNKT